MGKNYVRFEVTPATAGPLFDQEVRGYARLIDRARNVILGEFHFEVDGEFVELVIKASEMTI